MKVKAGICPKCNSEKITYDAAYPQDNDMIYPFTCDDCKFSGEEVYASVFVGMEIDGEFQDEAE